MFSFSWSTQLLTKTNKDLVIVGSDSGKVIILEFNLAEKRFTKTHEETFGKSGCRRIVPGNLSFMQDSLLLLIQEVNPSWSLLSKNKNLFILSKDKTRTSLLAHHAKHISLMLYVVLSLP